jgi:DNA-binding transcriptional regulator GbsR (MarR family)
MSVNEYLTNMKTKKKIDKHLEAMAKLRATLGSDSTNREKQEVQKKCNEHMRAIKDIDKEYYQVISLDK